jgi:hypothetical protein
MVPAANPLRGRDAHKRSRSLLIRSPAHGIAGAPGIPVDDQHWRRCASRRATNSCVRSNHLPNRTHRRRLALTRSPMFSRSISRRGRPSRGRPASRPELILTSLRKPKPHPSVASGAGGLKQGFSVRGPDCEVRKYLLICCMRNSHASLRRRIAAASPPQRAVRNEVSLHVPRC